MWETFWLWTSLLVACVLVTDFVYYVFTRARQLKQGEDVHLPAWFTAEECKAFYMERFKETSPVCNEERRAIYPGDKVRVRDGIMARWEGVVRDILTDVELPVKVRFTEANGRELRLGGFTERFNATDLLVIEPNESGWYEYPPVKD